MTETVDIYVPLYDGLSFPIGEACLTIRPNEDCAFKYGIACDVTYENPFTGKSHAYPSDRSEALLKDVHDNDKDKWSQIERAARLNSRPDYEDCEPVSYTAHYAEDEWATTTLGR